uniref:Uncharacterized protein n=1 Tax=Cuerna arida TaxID=1464854 RepID=A0A1B6F516_9HEMI
MALRMPEVQSCCCYFSLRTGTKIFGFFSLVVGVLLVFMSVADLLHLLSINYEEYKIVLAELVLEIFIHIIQLVTSFLLLLGVYQENSKLIPPWLVTTVIVAVSELFLIPSSLLSRVVNEFSDPLPNTWVFLVILGLFDDIYGFLVVYSFYRTLPPMATNPV